MKSTNYRYLVKREDVYSRLLFNQRLKGAIAILIGILFMMVAMVVAPSLLNIYTELNVAPPLITEYSIFVSLVLAVLTSIFGIQYILKNPEIDKINKKLEQFKAHEMININRFNDRTYDLQIMAILACMVVFLFLSLLLPIYNLTINTTLLEGNISEDEITNQWSVYKIEDSSFSFKYPSQAKIEKDNENGCIYITYGLAYLAIKNPKSEDEKCISLENKDNSTKLEEKKLQIDNTIYYFKRNYLKGEKDHEYFLNTQGVFGNGFIVEYGGHFKLKDINKYEKDKNIVKSVLESTYRD